MLAGRGDCDCEYLALTPFAPRWKPLSVCGAGLWAEYNEETSKTELLDDLRALARSLFSSRLFRSRSSLSSRFTSTCSTIIPFSSNVTSRP